MRLTLWLKRAFLLMTAVVAVVAVSGAAIEQTVRTRVPERNPVRGKLVTVEGGRRIQMDCRGSGQPTVVLESGLDLYGSLSWTLVQDSIARTTRVCSYSRAGIMWSDSRGSFSADDVARDLHAALVTSGERAPWVMAGHSIGGAYVMAFTRLFEAEVSGIVLVDASHPDQFSHMLAATGKQLAPVDPAASIGATLAWTGLLRLIPMPPTPANWPREIGVTSGDFFPTSLKAAVAEMHAAPGTLESVGSYRRLGSRPLVVLSAGLGLQPGELQGLGLSEEQGRRLHAVKRVLQADMATWSSRGRQRFVEGAGHYIQLDRPDAVIAAVREVVRESVTEAPR